MPGYTTPVFKDKEEQRAKLQSTVTTKGCILCELVANEVQWFYAHLGIDDTYFRNESVDVIADHILALFGTKILAYTKRDSSKLVIDLERIDEQGNTATFIYTSPPGKAVTEGPNATVESRIDEQFLGVSTPERCYRLGTYRSTGPTSSTANQQPCCYFMSFCRLPMQAMA
ncbi:hypothetical protein K488DRAFT_72957 [Vararia minispora EC-137]|uniref:Uncharacterized protein n=1 Tax=Vararia minispora EC-137 TaxID=1314806 RepID=A0ACB8QCK2_9AGAM|nr:hypothetical protein K488DRAFT_72957 [Vararia minispora EC-137]